MLTLATITIIPEWAIDGFESVLRFWYDIVGNWGWAIILLTFTIRLLILPLTFTSVKSMQSLQVLQPEIKKIQERYKDDRQRMNQEMMKFYQENKVNPLGSCLPLLLQLPFFLALFQLLNSQAFKDDIASNPGFGPIDNLAEKLTDQPVLLGFMIVLYIGTQLIASMITSIGGDQMQKRLMMALPFVFAIFIINFPAGLIVYWITTNVWTIGQQLAVRKLFPKPVIATAGAAAAVEQKPARGKPPSAKAAAADGDGKGSKDAKPAKRGKGAQAKGKADGSNGAKAPPPSPRRKKKRSGRRR